MSERGLGFILWWIVGGAFLLRMYHLGAESAWTDELWAIQRAESGVARAIESQASRADPNWIHDCLLFIWIQLWGNSEYSTRFLSVLFGTMAVYAMYKVGEILFDRNTGIAASVMLSVSILHIDFSQQVRMYAISSCLTLISYYCFVRLLVRESTACYFGWFVATVVSFYTHVLCALALVGQSMYLLLRRRHIESSILDRFLILHMGLVLAANPCLYVILNSSSPLDKAKTYLGAWGQPVFGDVADMFTEFAGSVPLLVLFACVIGISACSALFWRGSDMTTGNPESASAPNIINRNDSVLLVALWFAIPFLVILSLSIAVPSFHGMWRARYLYGASLAFTLLAAHMYSLIQWPWIRFGIAVLFVGLSCGALYHHDQILNRQQIRQACDFIAERASTGDQVVIYPEHYRSLIAPYYLDVPNLTLRSLPELGPDQHNRVRDKWLSILRNSRRTWLLCLLDQDESRDRDLQAILSLVRETIAGNWRVLIDKPYLSSTRILCSPYVGAHLMLLEPERGIRRRHAGRSSK